MITWPCDHNKQNKDGYLTTVSIVCHSPHLPNLRTMGLSQYAMISSSPGQVIDKQNKDGGYLTTVSFVCHSLLSVIPILCYPQLSLIFYYLSLSFIWCFNCTSFPIFCHFSLYVIPLCLSFSIVSHLQLYVIPIALHVIPHCM